LPLQIPPGGLYLVLQQKPSGSLDNGFSPLQLNWQDAHRFDPHDGVALARLLPGPALDRFFNLPVARPQTEPRRFYSDSLENTDWQDWVLDDDASSEESAHFLGLQVDVDTSAADFTKIPCYFVWFSGDLWSTDLPAKYEEGRVPPSDFPLLKRLTRGWEAIQILVMRFGHIVEPTPTGFIYRLRMPRALIPPREIEIDRLFELARQNRFTLNWLGIEMDHEIKENYELTGQNPHD
jgi:hypothetical protein